MPKTRIEVNFVSGGSVRTYEQIVGGESRRAVSQDIVIGVAARIYGMVDAGRESFSRVFDQQYPSLKRKFDFVPPKRKFPPNFVSARERAFIISRMREIAMARGEGESDGYLPHYNRSGNINRSWTALVVDNTMPGMRKGDWVVNNGNGAWSPNINLGEVNPGDPKSRALIGLQIRNTALDELGQFYAGYVYGLPSVYTAIGADKGRGYQYNVVGEDYYSGAMAQMKTSQLPWHAEQGWPYMPKVIAEWSKRFSDRWIDTLQSEQGKEKFRRPVRLPTRGRGLFNIEF